MARYPKAEWRPLGDDQSHQPLMAKHDGILAHTMVGSLAGTDAYFRQGGYSGTESHFGVGYDGTVYQWVDTARTADANLDGNPRLLSIETADSGTGFPAWTGSNVPAWLPAQIEAIAGIIAWASRVHHFPAVFMPDSLPQRRGVGYHRQGIDPWRIAGGEHWSTSQGKVCPGDRRIAQFHSVLLPRVQQLLQGEPWPKLHTTTDTMATVQGKLTVAGYYHGGDEPGYYGPNSRIAVRELQLAQGWKDDGADGLFGPMTWDLVQALPDEPKDPEFPGVEAVEKALRPIAAAHPHWTQVVEAEKQLTDFLNPA